MRSLAVILVLALAVPCVAQQRYLAATLGESQVSSASTLTLSTSVRNYTFSGTTGTWTLPAVAGNTGVWFDLKNRGSGNLTLQRAGSDQLYTTSAVTSFAIGASTSYRVYSDGTYWIVQTTPADTGELAGLKTMASTGIVTRTDAGSYAQRVLTGTTDQITVTNGNGVSGNPTLSLPASLTVPGNLSFTAGSNVLLNFNRSGTGGYCRLMFQTGGTEEWALGMRGDSGGTGVINTLTLSGLAADGYPAIFNITPGTPYTWYVNSGVRFSLQGQLSLGTAGTSLTIASGVVTITKSYHEIDTESAAASDDLDTINGGSGGVTLVVRAANTNRTVVLKDGTGNLKLAGDCSLDNSEDTITLIYNGSAWLETARSNNGT